MEPPAHFLCPISYDLMRDPVMLVETGQIYERDAIERWFARGNTTDPLTNARVVDTKLAPVFALRSAVEQWVEQQDQQLRLGTPGLTDVLVPQIAQERLTLGELLHDGAMATVSAATLQPGEQEVVVKVYRARGLTEDDTTKFRREMKIWHQASLLCHNVCRVIGVASINGQLCVVMPRYRTSLDKALQQHRESVESSGAGVAGKGLPFDRIRGISMDIAMAVADLHERGIMVLNLKPSNILLHKYAGLVFVADFGISAPRNSSTSDVPTAVQGTPNYMAPEQWVPDEFGGVTTAADAWAFGCILVDMASACTPWAGLSTHEIKANVTAPRKMCPAIPEGLPSAVVDLLHRCFSYQPTGRPTFTEIITVLRQVVTAGAGVRQPPPPRRSRKPSLQDWLQDCPKTSRGTLDVPQSFLQAAREGRLDAIRQLLLLGVSLGVTDKSGRNALLLAANEGHLKLVKFLAEDEGMSLDARDWAGYNAVILAAEGGHLRLVKYLVEDMEMSLDDTAKNGCNALYMAALKGHLELVKYLVEDKGMTLEDLAVVNNVPHHGCHTLHAAAWGGHLELVKYLVEDRGMRLDGRLETGTNAFHSAAAQGHVEIVKWMVEDKGMGLDSVSDTLHLKNEWSAYKRQATSRLLMLTYCLSKGRAQCSSSCCIPRSPGDGQVPGGDQGNEPGFQIPGWGQRAPCCCCGRPPGAGQVPVGGPGDEPRFQGQAWCQCASLRCCKRPSGAGQVPSGGKWDGPGWQGRGRTLCPFLRGQ
eukprot:jgi/Mesvir1/16886/Mv15767-RA.3